MNRKSLFLIYLVLTVLITSVAFLPAVLASDTVSRAEFATEVSRILSLPVASVRVEGDQNTSVTRLEAARTVIRALAYENLYPFISPSPIPFPDAAGLGEASRRTVILASSLQPPLFTGDAEGNFRPLEAISQREFSYLKDRLSGYAKGDIAAEIRTVPQQGMELLVRKRGVERTPVTPLPQNGVILQAGAFAERDRAERAAQWLTELGHPARVIHEDGFHKVHVGPYPAGEVSEVQDRLRSQGFPSVIVSRGPPTSPDEEGPVFTLAFLFDPRQSTRSAEIALAHNTILEREKTSELARRLNAYFAINAGFFANDGTPIGLLMIDRHIYREPHPGWFVAGFAPDGRLTIGEVRMESELTLPGGEIYSIGGINRSNAGNELTLFDSFYGPRTPFQDGVETLLQGGRVIQTGPTGGNTSIPAGGYVLQGKGDAATWMMRNLIPGTNVRLRFALYPQSGNIDIWQNARHIISGGPLLYREGRPGPFGSFRPEITDRRHPRTVLGITEDGRHLYMVVDGRRAGHSSGLTIPELVRELSRYNVTDALNLDGGGSVTFYLEGEILNQPADITGERKVSTVIFIR